MAYSIEDGVPAIRFFQDSTLVTQWQDDGFPAQRRTVQYRIDTLGSNFLRLEGIDQPGIYQFYPTEGTSFGRITFEDIWRGVLGMSVLIFLTCLMSANKRLINWRLVLTGLAIQLAFAFLVLKVDFVKTVFSGISSFFIWILDFSKYGATFLFGETLVNDPSFGAIFAFQILPTIVFFSALSSILYYLGIMQRIVYVFAWAMSRTMRLSGAESLAAAANIFIGQTEAPLVVKPYLDKMTKSEMLCLMVGGMATIAGGVFAAYVGFLGGNDPEQMQFFATHLLTASIMSAPAAIVAAKILYPEDQSSVDRKIIIPKEKIGSNFLDAISNGTTDGLKLAINVGAMLLTFTALIYMVNVILGNVGGWMGVNEAIAASTGGRFDELSLDYMLGMALSPLAWILGTPSQDILIVGELLGKKTIVNEFIAYQAMESVKAEGAIHSQKAIIIATYALCGFANFASIGIQIGGIGAIAPKQRKLLARFGIRALIGGTVAAFMTAVIAGAIV
jgi:CNT family concentrative nucleoside transporter